MAELGVDEPLPPEYWEQLGMEGDQARKSDPFSAPPPGAGENPFEGHGGPSGRSRYEAGWLRTHGGVDFIRVFVGEIPGSEDKEVLIFLFEVMPGRFNVGFSRPKTTRGGEFRYKDKSYEEAKRLAEEEAMAMSVDAGAAADWREDLPSLGQLGFARRLGINTDQMQSKGEVSDAINVITASRTLDPSFAKESKQ